MKKCLPLLLLCLLLKVAAYADAEYPSYATPDANSEYPSYTTSDANPECPCPSYALPYPAFCETCNNIYGFAEFLYWKAHEDGLAWAASQTGAFATPASATTAEPNWKWKPGFRVGLGHVFACTGWDLSLAYTWYRSQAVDSRTFNPAAPVAFDLFGTNSTAGGRANWCLNYQTLDLALKQPFFVGEKVTLTPSLSLFGAYTSERYNIETIVQGTQAPSINYMSNRQKLYCIGPKMGFDSAWLLSDCWSIFGEGSIAFLWAHYHVSRFDLRVGDDAGVTANLKNKFDTLRIVPTYVIGLEWNKSIDEGSYCLNFMVAWEQQIWLQHNQLFLLSVAHDNTLLFNNTNLSLYGLTVRLGMQF